MNHIDVLAASQGDQSRRICSEVLGSFSLAHVARCESRPCKEFSLQLYWPAPAPVLSLPPRSRFFGMLRVLCHISGRASSTWMDGSYMATSQVAGHVSLCMSRAVVVVRMSEDEAPGWLDCMPYTWTGWATVVGSEPAERAAGPLRLRRGSRSEGPSRRVHLSLSSISGRKICKSLRNPCFIPVFSRNEPACPQSSEGML
jgi:hypothetical protein